MLGPIRGIGTPQVSKPILYGSATGSKRFIERKNFTFPVYLPATSFPKVFNSPFIPTTFIISPEGNIVAGQEGMARYDTKEVREFLQGLVQ